MSRRLTGRAQRSGRRYELAVSGQHKGQREYIVYRGDRVLGRVWRTARGWNARSTAGTIVLREYPGSRDVAAAALEETVAGASRTRGGSSIKARWAEVHAAEAAGRPIRHPRAYVFGSAPPGASRRRAKRRR